MRLGTSPRLALTLAHDVAIAPGVGTSATAIILMTEYHAGHGELTDAPRQQIEAATRDARTTTTKTKNNSTPRKPKELRRWPMLH
jgi:hypothetical protein